MKNIINIIKVNFKDILLFQGIIIVVTVIWQLLELIFYKEVMPDHIDSVVAIILSTSIYTNVMLYRETKKK